MMFPAGQSCGVGITWPLVFPFGIFPSGCSLLHPVNVLVVRRRDNPVWDCPICILGGIFRAFVQPAFFFAVAVGKGEHRGVIVVNTREILPEAV